MESKDIPKIIWQSWKTKNLEGKMKENVDRVKEMNPEYKHILADDNDCRDFLMKHFGYNHVNAFDSLVPGAFKCDFWRYAVLYIHGGVYIDIDMVPLKPLREIIEPTDEFLSVADRDVLCTMGCAIYQAFIATVPRHPIIYYSLQLSFSNIAMRSFDNMEPLSVTGPVVVGVAFNLFRRVRDTFRKIKAGKYPSGVRLLSFNDDGYVKDLEGKNIIKGAYDDYDRGPMAYGKNLSHYKDDPRLSRRKTIFTILIVFVVAFIVIMILMFVFRKKWSKCKRSCSL